MASASVNEQSQVASSSSTPVTKYFRRVIRIRAEDSPNVQFALAEIASGKKPSNTVLIPGVITWEEYQRRRRIWDTRRQTIGLDGMFYEGAEVLLFPAAWLTRSLQLAELLKRHKVKRNPKTIGIDPGEGEADTSMAVVDEYGLVKLKSRKTPDTSVIEGDTIALGREFGVKPEHWWFDRGGGGKQIADRLRKRGYNVNTVAFGEAATPPAGKTFDGGELKDKEEGRTTYKNRRAEMYDSLSLACDPLESTEVEIGGPGFAIAHETEDEVELHRQLGLIPKMFDGNGVMYLPPKNRRDKNSTEVTLTEIVGRSPDQADGLVVARWAMGRPDRRPTVGVW